MSRTIKVSNLPSYVTPEDFHRLFSECEGFLGDKLMGRQASGDLLGYADFQDISSAATAINQLQGHLGLGGKGLHLEHSTMTNAQIELAGSGQKRPREDGGADPNLQPPKQLRNDLMQPNVASLLQGIDPRLVQSVAHRPAVPPAPAEEEVPPPPPPPPPAALQQPVGPMRSAHTTHPMLSATGAGVPPPAPYPPTAVPPPAPASAVNYTPAQAYDHHQPPLAGGGGGAVYQPAEYASSAYLMAQQPSYQEQYHPDYPDYSRQQMAPPQHQQQHTRPMQSSYQQPPPQQQYPASPPQQQQYAAPPLPLPLKQPQPMFAAAAAPPPPPPLQQQQQYSKDASPTLFTEGFPPGTTKREIAHIFRHFPGYLGLRLILKDSKRFAGEKLYMSFIEFDTIPNAHEAMKQLNGYVFDLDDPESLKLRIKYATPMENPILLNRKASGGGRGRGDQRQKHGGRGGAQNKNKKQRQQQNKN